MSVYLYFCRYCGNVVASGNKADHRDDLYCRVCHVTAPHARIDMAAEFGVPIDRQAAESLSWQSETGGRE
jgi:hypothetical protein